MGYGLVGMQLKVIGVLCLELAFMAAVVVVTLTKLHTHASRSNLVGIFCVVFGVLMYASPLTVMVRLLIFNPIFYIYIYIYISINKACQFLNRKR